jgi:hypothetical protein
MNLKLSIGFIPSVLMPLRPKFGKCNGGAYLITPLEKAGIILVRIIYYLVPSQESNISAFSG